MEDTQVNLDLLIEELAQRYAGYVEASPSPFETQSQIKEKVLTDLKEFFRMNSLNEYLLRAIPAIFRKCKEELTAEEWTVFKADLENATEHLQNTLRAKQSIVTLASAFNFSENTLKKFEWAAKEYFFANEYRIAAAIFVFLTVLDPLADEYWICCGISHHENKAYTDALACFSAASLLNSENALSHLFSAECYRKIFDLASAKEELARGKKNLNLAQSQDPELHAMAEMLERKLAI